MDASAIQGFAYFAPVRRVPFTREINVGNGWSWAPACDDSLFFRRFFYRTLMGSTTLDQTRGKHNNEKKKRRRAPEDINKDDGKQGMYNWDSNQYFLAH
jgi:hypothetical protein